MANKSCIECPICMDDIDITKNCVTTECSHTFHCSCLLQNAAHNGFGCPYCRKELAEELIDEEDDDYDEDEDEDEDDEDFILDDEEDEEPFANRPLTSFRMFHQRLNDEEVEEDLEEELEEDETEEENQDVPNAAYIGRKLEERGINYDQLVKSLLHLEHVITLRGTPMDYQRTSMKIYGEIRSIIHGYIRRQEQN
jgi:hypothetical protein